MKEFFTLLGAAMYMSDPLDDEQTLMRYLPGNRLRQLLDSSAAIADWEFVTAKAATTNHPQSRPPYGSLWMSFPGGFSDPDEGTFPALNCDDETYCREMAKLLKLDAAEAERRRKQFTEKRPSHWRAGIRVRSRLCGVSCWCQSSDELSDMWDVFGRDNEGVLVMTTVKRLNDSLGYVTPVDGNKASRPSICTINYVDLDDYFLANDGYRHLLGIIGEGYMHEREVRLIGRSPRLCIAADGIRTPSTEELEQLATKPPSGFNLLVNLNCLISELRVHPTASTEYTQRTRDLFSQTGLSEELVKPSQLT